MKIFLWLHILAGTTALLSGALAIAFPKGKSLHILSGRVYVLSMLAALVPAMVLAIAKDLVFLQGIALFSLYQCLGGYRVVTNRKGQTGMSDYFLLILGTVAGIWMGVMGLGGPEVNYIGLVFCLLCLGQTLRDARLLIKPPARSVSAKARIPNHIGKMGGAYIATFTAFIVVNNHFLPAVVAWLLPTAVGVPMIFISIRKWMNKMKPLKAGSGATE